MFALASLAISFFIFSVIVFFLKEDNRINSVEKIYNIVFWYSSIITCALFLTVCIVTLVTNVE